MKIVILIFLQGTSAMQDDKAGHDWGYDGAEGPSHRGNMKPEFAACKNGHHQSPVNISKYPAGRSAPPYSENVTWFVLKNPVTVTAAEIEKFREAMPTTKHGRLSRSIPSGWKQVNRLPATLTNRCS
jgi:carbonic anhydrase